MAGVGVFLIHALGVVALGLDIPAQGDGGDEILGPTLGEANQFRAEAEGELEHPDTKELGDQEMPELVEQDQEAEDEEKCDKGEGHGIVNDILS
jgi:hypothetical protein